MWKTNRVINGHGCCCCCFYSLSVPEGAVLQKAASALAVPWHLAFRIPGSAEFHSSGSWRSRVLLLEKQMLLCISVDACSLLLNTLNRGTSATSAR